MVTARSLPSVGHPALGLGSHHTWCMGLEGDHSCWSLSSTGTFSQLWGFKCSCRVRASSRKGVSVVVRCVAAAMENNGQKCKEIENGEAQGAPPAKKNWSQTDLKDDLNYLGMCIQQGKDNALNKLS